MATWPTAVAGAGEVGVRLEASGVNPPMSAAVAAAIARWNIHRVIPNSDGAGSSIRRRRRYAPQARSARLAVQTASATAAPSRTAAEYIALAEHLVTPLPDRPVVCRRRDFGHSRRRAVVLPFLRRPDHGQKVLVTAAPARFGHYAVQLAKWGGAQVIATASSGPRRSRRGFAGADLVVNYRNDDVIAKTIAFTGQRAFDRVVDVDFDGNIDTTLKLNGHELDHRGLRHQRQPHAGRADARADGKMHRPARAGAVRAAPPLLAAAQADITKVARRGPSHPQHRRAVPLSDTAQAHLAVEKGDKLGTVIVDCAR